MSEAELKRTIGELRQSLDRAEDDLLKSRGKHSDLQWNLDIATSYRNEYQENLKLANEKLSTLQHRFDIINGTNSGLSRDLLEAHGKHSKLNEDLKLANQHIRSTEAHCSKLQAENDGLKSVNEKLKGDLAEMKRIEGQREEHIDAAETRIKELESEVTTLQTHIKQLSKNIKDSENVMRSQQATMRGNEKKIAAQTKELQTSNESLRKNVENDKRWEEQIQALEASWKADMTRMEQETNLVQAADGTWKDKDVYVAELEEAKRHWEDATGGISGDIRNVFSEMERKDRLIASLEGKEPLPPKNEYVNETGRTRRRRKRRPGDRFKEPLDEAAFVSLPSSPTLDAIHDAALVPLPQSPTLNTTDDAALLPLPPSPKLDTIDDAALVALPPSPPMDPIASLDATVSSDPLEDATMVALPPSPTLNPLAPPDSTVLPDPDQIGTAAGSSSVGFRTSRTRIAIYLMIFIISLGLWWTYRQYSAVWEEQALWTRANTYAYPLSNHSLRLQGISSLSGAARKEALAYWRKGEVEMVPMKAIEARRFVPGNPFKDFEY